MDGLEAKLLCVAHGGGAAAHPKGAQQGAGAALLFRKEIIAVRINPL